MRVLAAFTAALSFAVFAAQYLLSESWALIAALCLALCSVLTLLLKSPTLRKRALIIALGLICGLSWSVFYGRVFFSPAERLDGYEGRVYLTALGFAEKSDYGFRLKAKARLENDADVTVILYGDESVAKARPGDSVAGRVELKLADESRGEETGYYFASGIYLFAYGEELKLYPEGGFSLKYIGSYISRAVGERIDRLFSGENAAFLRALLIGDTGPLRRDETLSYLLRRSGLSHIVAVSGLHVSFISGLVMRFFRRKRVGAIFSLPLVFLFMAVTGFTPGVVRAGVMQAFMAAAPIVKRENDLPTALFSALALLLLLNPYAAKSVSLQLSFAATAGIYLVPRPSLWKGKAKGRLKILWRRAVGAVLDTALASAGAAVFTVPLTALYFGSVSLIAPVSNILVFWAVSLAFALGVASVCLSFVFLPLGAAAAIPAGALAGYIRFAASLMGKMRFAALPAGLWTVRCWLLLLYAMALSAVVFRKKLGPVIPLGLCTIGLCAALFLSARPFARFGAAFLDVGQGACSVLTTGKLTVVIDCGGNKGNAGAAAADYIMGLGRKRVDILILTHTHADHADGAELLCSVLDVGSVITCLPADGDETALDISGLGKEPAYIEADTLISGEGLNIRLLAPAADAEGNEKCLAVMCSAQGYDILYMGDLGLESEKALCKRLGDTDILAVGHHGSKYSTGEELLSAARPETAVISAGYNTYGHPSGETVKRLEKYGVSILRTDKNGNIVFETK